LWVAIRFVSEALRIDPRPLRRHAELNLSFRQTEQCKRMVYAVVIFVTIAFRL
jgi:hypothetical protein